MKTRNSIISNLIVIFFFSITIELNAQINLSRNDFSGKIKQYNLIFEMPKGFFAPDSIDKKLCLANRVFNTDYQILAADSSVKICFITMKQSREQEEKIRRLFPEHDITKEYLKFIPFLCKNAGDSEFIDKEIEYYNGPLRKKMNADLGLEYIIKLKKPYDGRYNFLRYKFLQQNYISKIVVFQFYEGIEKKRENGLKDIIRFGK